MSLARLTVAGKIVFCQLVQFPLIDWYAVMSWLKSDRSLGAPGPREFLNAVMSMGRARPSVTNVWTAIHSLFARQKAGPPVSPGWAIAAGAMLGVGSLMLLSPRWCGL